MSHVVTPALDAAVAAAPCTECTLNMAVSMAAFSSSHWAIVELEAGECGLIEVRRRNVNPVSFRTDCVFSSYALRVTTGQSSPLGGKAGKKYSAIGLYWRDCFANFVGWKATPSGRYLLNLKSSWDRSADLDGLVRARSTTNLCVSSASERESNDSM